MSVNFTGYPFTGAGHGKTGNFNRIGKSEGGRPFNQRRHRHSQISAGSRCDGAVRSTQDLYTAFECDRGYAVRQH